MTDAVIGDKAIKLPGSSGTITDSEREHGATMLRYNTTDMVGEFSTDGTNWSAFGAGGSSDTLATTQPQTPAAGSAFWGSDKKIKIYVGTEWLTDMDAFALDDALNGNQSSGGKTSLANPMGNNTRDVNATDPQDRWIGRNLHWLSFASSSDVTFRSYAAYADGISFTTPDTGTEYIEVGGVRVYGVHLFTGGLFDGQIHFYYTLVDSNSKELVLTLTNGNDTETLNVTFTRNRTALNVDDLTSSIGTYRIEVTIDQAKRDEFKRIFGGGSPYSGNDTIDLTIAEA